MAENEWEMVPVTSLQINAVGFNASTQQIRVEFSKGQLYQYEGCTQSEYDELINAGSVGQTFAATIKNIKPFRRLV